MKQVVGLRIYGEETTLTRREHLGPIVLRNCLVMKITEVQYVKF